jgi:hypothetical protein
MPKSKEILNEILEAARNEVGSGRKRRDKAA